jgi:biotin carboxyl carrier protein
VRFDVETNGRRHAVDARREGNSWRVTCNGREMTADLERVGERWSLLIGPPEGGPYTIGPPEGGPHITQADVGAGFSRPKAVSGFSQTSRSYDVSIESRGRGDRIVHVDGQTVPVSLMNARALVTRRRDTSVASHAGVTSVAAMMPGRVVRVLVEPGDRVAARQALVVVEAMKMENEVRSPRAGSVRDVRVAAGASVEAGDVLVVIE